jgi:hypothetical protein
MRRARRLVRTNPEAAELFERVRRGENGGTDG